MRHLNKHNEIFGFFKSKNKPKMPSEVEAKKDSMWIINPKLNLTFPK